MILEYTLTKEDLFAFNFYTGWTSPEKRNYRIRYYLKVIGYSFIGALVVVLINRNDLMGVLKFAIPFGLIWGLISAYIGIEVRYKNQINKFINDEKNAGMYSRLELHLTEYGIVTRDEKTESKYNWDAIVKKAETPEYFYLYLSGAHGLIIPKQAVTEAGQDELRKLLSRNLSLSAEFK